jgi:tetratricopeptide (TPR) repeat protein
MIGMCYREANNPTEAIHQFKQGLHAEPSDREQLSIYYEIGVTYESIEDWPEALYYYDTVAKRDPNFADAAMRADQLRDRGTPSHSSLDDDL